MKLLETLDSIRVCDDEKARRVLNVSNVHANITADEIESGVTIERLSALNVPVFRYSTQVTIHGAMPDFDPSTRPLGYKAIFKNQNGSLGIKYIAIDGAKKQLIVQASRLSKTGKFSASLNSTGLELVLQTFEKEKALAEFRTFPRDLIIGGVYAARGMYGEFYVIADVGAIEAKNLWPLIGVLYGFSSQADMDRAQAVQDAEYAVRRAQSEKEWEARRIERERINAENKAKAQNALANYTKMTAMPTVPFDFITVNDSGEVYLYTVRKKAFGLCYTSARFNPGDPLPVIDPNRKMKRWQDKRPVIQRRIEAGQVFEVKQ